MNYREKVKKAKEITTHYENVLRSYGFQSVDVNASFSLTSLKEIKAYFGNCQCGYDLMIRCFSEDIGIERAISTCDEIISFVSDPTPLSSFDISKEFSQYLFCKSFDNILLTSWSNANLAYMTALKDDVKYIISLNKKAFKTTYLDSSATDDPIDFSPAEMDQYKKIFDQLLHDIADSEDYQVELKASLDELRVTMHQKLDKYCLEVLCDTDLTWGVEDSFCEIIRCWYDALIGQFSFSLCLERHSFHISQNSADGNSFVCHRKGHSFRVKKSSERVIDFDKMEGHMFEHFCAEVLSLNGYEQVTVTQGSGDQGIDIIAYKDNAKYGIQCKCYSADIGNKAVQEVFAGKTYYHCHLGVVLTNRYFTKAAIQLASNNGVVLWNRDKLSEMVEKCKGQLMRNYGR